MIQGVLGVAIVIGDITDGREFGIESRHKRDSAVGVLTPGFPLWDIWPRERLDLLIVRSKTL